MDQLLLLGDDWDCAVEPMASHRVDVGNTQVPNPEKCESAAASATTAMAEAGSVDLLAYYRQRIEDFETERAEFLRKFKDLEVWACARGDGVGGKEKGVPSVKEQHRGFQYGRW